MTRPAYHFDVPCRTLYLSGRTTKNEESEKTTERAKKRQWDKTLEDNGKRGKRENEFAGKVNFSLT